MKTPAQLHASLLTSNGIDLKKDYFKLTTEELSKVEKIRKAFKFSGRNKNGLPPCRQFYIHCQKAHKENQPHTIPEPQPSRLTIAINHANGIVSRFDEDDPYAAYNHLQAFNNTHYTRAVVRCSQIYTIGMGEYERKSCTLCPLFDFCLCENRVIPTNPAN